MSYISYVRYKRPIDDGLRKKQQEARKSRKVSTQIASFIAIKCEHYYQKLLGVVAALPRVVEGRLSDHQMYIKKQSSRIPNLKY